MLVDSGVVLEALKRVVRVYERENFIRTADFHQEDCDCFRCAMDHAGAIVDELKRRSDALDELFAMDGDLYGDPKEEPET